MPKIIEEKIREFDDQFVPIDWLLFSAKESPGGDRGVDVVVANYHADRIKLWLKAVLTEVVTAQREETIEMLKKMKESNVCTHYQDNCSCLNAHDTKVHNAALDQAIKKLV